MSRDEIKFHILYISHSGNHQGLRASQYTILNPPAFSTKHMPMFSTKGVLNLQKMQNLTVQMLQKLVIVFRSAIRSVSRMSSVL
jgi:hypothetical protein